MIKPTGKSVGSFVLAEGVSKFFSLELQPDSSSCSDDYIIDAAQTFETASLKK